MIARGIFTSVADLERKTHRYIRHYNKAPSRSAGRIATRRIELVVLQPVRSTSASWRARLRTSAPPEDGRDHRSHDGLLEPFLRPLEITAETSRETPASPAVRQMPVGGGRSDVRRSSTRIAAAIGLKRR